MSLLTLGFVIERQQQEVNSLHRWLFFRSSRPYTLVNCLGERNFLVSNSKSFWKEKSTPLWLGLWSEGTNKAVRHWEGRSCTSLGLYWHPSDPYRSWSKYINEKKCIEWLIAICMRFYCSSYWTRPLLCHECWCWLKGCRWERTYWGGQQMIIRAAFQAAVSGNSILKA